MIHEGLNVLLQSTLLLCLGLLAAQLPGTSAGFRHLLLASAMGWLFLLPWAPDVAPVAVPSVTLPQVDLAWFEDTVVAAGPATVNATGSGGWSILAVAAAAYVGVVAFLALRYLLEVLQVARLVRRGRRFASDGAMAPMVQLGEARVSPFVWGLFRQRIVVPAGAHRWSVPRMRMVVAHEQAHLDRGDVWVALLARVLCWLYWWHPLVWIARRQLLGLAEQACDDAVLAKGISPEGYAQELIDITRMTRPQVTPAMASTTHLARRVKALLDHKVRRTHMSIYRTLITVTLATVCLLPFTRLSVAADPSPPPLDATTYASLSEVQALIDKDELNRAGSQLDAMLGKANLEPQAYAQIQNMRGYVAFLDEDYASAIGHYEEVIAQPERIPVGLHQATLYTLAQLNFVQEQYPRAIEYIEQWMTLADNPGPIPFIFIGQTLYQMEDYPAALDYIERGLAESAARGKAPKENWLKLRDYLRVQTGAAPDGGDISRDFLKPARDSELMPIVKVKPVYPAAAKADRLEGYVLVEFTVTSTGGVSNPLVVEAEPPGVFDAAALAAVRKFKYKPRLADGVAVDTSGIRNRITFVLPEDDAS